MATKNKKVQHWGRIKKFFLAKVLILIYRLIFIVFICNNFYKNQIEKTFLKKSFNKLKREKNFVRYFKFNCCFTSNGRGGQKDILYTDILSKSILSTFTCFGVIYLKHSIFFLVILSTFCVQYFCLVILSTIILSTDISSTAFCLQSFCLLSFCQQLLCI